MHHAPSTQATAGRRDSTSVQFEGWQVNVSIAPRDNASRLGARVNLSYSRPPAFCFFKYKIKYKVTCFCATYSHKSDLCKVVIGCQDDQPSHKSLHRNVSMVLKSNALESHKINAKFKDDDWCKHYILWSDVCLITAACITSSFHFQHQRSD